MGQLETERETDRPTVLMARETLVGLVRQTARATPHVRTVPRRELRARATTQRGQIDADLQDDVDEVNLAPAVSPWMIITVVVVLVMVFVAVVRLG